ncbi:MAG: hypothetical protein ABMA25_17005 [Ilumatobacteraceae bacterium]
MDELATNVLTFAVLGFMGFRLVTGLRRSRTHDGRTLVRDIVRRVRWRHVWPVPLLLSTVIVVATALVQIPGLSWGWWSMLGGNGNPVFGSSDATTGTVWEWLIPVVFISLLLPALPLFAYAEERMFRSGAESWQRGKRVLKCVQFGMVHALIGIPIGAAMALSIGGAYFMWVYLRAYRTSRSRRDATLESTAAHTAYNAIVITLVVLAIVVASAVA